MRTFSLTCVLLGLTSSAALAQPTVTVSTSDPRPGDAVLVMVTGATRAPTGTVSGRKLELFPARGGYQAVVAVPFDPPPGLLEIAVEGAGRPIVLHVRERIFPDANVVVEDEYANPGAEERREIDADNRAILAAFGKARGEPQFGQAFRRPPGRVTSQYGDWRTFNDGHRSQHLGLDLAAREGARVSAINAGTVVLVRDCFLAGKTVVIAHGGGIASAYFHLSQIDVAEGDLVVRGARLGLAGATGRATGSHLHLAVHTANGFVDPESFLKLRLSPRLTVVGAR